MTALVDEIAGLRSVCRALEHRAIGPARTVCQYWHTTPWGRSAMRGDHGARGSVDPTLACDWAFDEMVGLVSKKLGGSRTYAEERDVRAGAGSHPSAIGVFAAGARAGRELQVRSAS